MKDEIIIYQADQASTRIEVRIEDNTVWLSQEQMAYLFGRNRVSITQHIGNIFKEEELIKEVVCKEFLLTTQHGAIQGKTQIKKLLLYNLDVIISVGYRVKSKEGTQFRIWATQILKDHLLKGQITNYRINNLENDMTFVKTKLQEIDIHLNTNLPPNHGIFFNGQVFDAYKFVSEIIKKAQNEIILVDN
ncbi:MAG: RhuM-like protein [Bacteroidetes bacterium]|nr:RhuM-like protein [Bacteroidota bacterium]